MTTVKKLLVVMSCGLMLLGAVAVQALGLGDDRQFGGPICFESPEVRVTGHPCPPLPEDPEVHADRREQPFRE